MVIILFGGFAVMRGRHFYCGLLRTVVEYSGPLRTVVNRCGLLRNIASRCGHKRRVLQLLPCASTFST